MMIVIIQELLYYYRFWPRLGQQQVKLYTLFRTARPKNHTSYPPYPPGAARPRIVQMRECPPGLKGQWNIENWEC